MKTSKAFIAEIVKIVISCITIPLYFVKLFRDTAMLPGMSENGESVVHKVYYYYSIFDKISREGMAFLIWGAIVVIVVSITLSALSMVFKENKALKVAGHVALGAAIIIFFVLLFVAASIRYGY